MKVTICYPSAGRPSEDFLASVELLIQLLQKAGIDVARARTRCGSLLPQARSLIAEEAVNDGADVLLWIDDDIIFDPQEALGMAQHCAEKYPILGTVCSTKEPGGQFTLRCLPETEELTFFKGGKILEVASIGLGMTAIQRQVFLDVQQIVPYVSSALGAKFHAYFCDLIENGIWPGEDIAFCQRAQKMGHRCYVDTRIRAAHEGTYRFRLEDCVHVVPWLETMTIRLADRAVVKPGTRDQGPGTGEDKDTTPSSPAQSPVPSPQSLVP